MPTVTTDGAELGNDAACAISSESVATPCTIWVQPTPAEVQLGTVRRCQRAQHDRLSAGIA
jgi:hypothetical protein